MGAKHTFSAEIPYGINDPRVCEIMTSRFPVARNWVLDDFMDGIMRGNRRDPAESQKQYVQWQRGINTATTRAEVQGWLATTVQHGVWLVGGDPRG